MQYGKYKNHPQRMVSRPRSIPFSGDVPLSLRETPIPKRPNLPEADANLQKIRKRTKVVSGLLPRGRYRLR